MLKILLALVILCAAAPAFPDDLGPNQNPRPVKHREQADSYKQNPKYSDHKPIKAKSNSQIADANARNQSSKSGQCHDCSESNPAWGRPIEWIGSGLVFVTLIALIFQGFANWRAANAAKKSADAAEASLKELQRASISFKEIDFAPIFLPTSVINEPDRWKCTPRMENNGSTRAKNLRVYGNWAIKDEPVDFYAIDLDSLGAANNPLDGEPATLGPRGILGIQPTSIPSGTLTQTQAAISKKYIYTWGWADYDDIFPNTRRHRTEFCVQIECLASASKEDPSIFSFHAVGPHNGQDEECSRNPKPYKPNIT
jgi:hypothetical protein